MSIRARALALVERWANWRTVTLLAALTLAMTAVFGWASQRYAARPGPDVVDLELSFSAGAFKQILLFWGQQHPQGVRAFWRTVLFLDSFFPLAYAAFGSALYTWVVRTAGRRPFPLVQLAPWLAALLDLCENALLLALLRGLHDVTQVAAATFSARTVLLMSSAAALKLALLTVTGALTVAALCSGARGRVLLRCRFSALSLLLGSLPLIALPQGRDLLLTLADPGANGIPARLFFFVFLVVWGVSSWYWARVILMARVSTDAPPTRDEQLFAAWIPRALGTLTIGLAGVGFLQARAMTGVRRTHWWMSAFAAVCLLLAAGFLLLVVHRRSLLKRVGVSMPAADQTTGAFDALPRGTRIAAAVSAAVSLVFFLLFTGLPVQAAPALGALTVLLVAAANTVFLGSVAVFCERKVGVSFVALGLVGAAVFSRWNDNHFVRLLADAPGQRIAQRPPLAQAFRDWFAGAQARCAGCPRVPVYLVAAEGGGIRAAYWTSGVLSRLEDARPGFSRRVFAISGVSGGSVGAAVYASLVRDAGRNALPAQTGRPLLEPLSRRILSGAFLAPALAKLVSGDFAQWFWPLPVHGFDRGTALENAWSGAYREATGQDSLDQPYLDAWPGPAAGVPALVLNGTHVQTGRRIIASPFSWTPDEVPDAYDLLGVLGSDVRLSTAAHNSARFSYVSPAGRLRAASGEDRGHIVDGGYFENSGAATLRDLLRELRGMQVTGAQPRFVVLYVCNSPERCHQSAVPQPADAWLRPANLAEWFSPLRALLGAREARGSLALTELRQEVGADFYELGVCQRLIAAERAAPLPLGWQLSEEVRAELDRQAHDPQCGAPDIP